VSGSASERGAGLRLIAPAVTLAIPVLLLLFGLRALPAPPETVPPPAPPPELIAALEPSEDLALVVDTPTTEPVSATPVATPEPPTPLPTRLPTSTPAPAWSGPSTFTFVALGVDRRNDQEIPRTDTIMLGKVDLRTPSVNLVSIPRDLLVDIPGYGKDRINAAYVYGEQFKEPGGGIGMLKRTIEKNFGLQIDHFGLVDFQCFRTAVDAVGGVNVNVPRLIVDTHYPTDDYGTKAVRFEPGMQKMDGERALEYARTRYADSDFQRMQRQQLIIAAMREQLLTLRTLPSLPTMLAGCRNMRSDLGWRDYLTLATTMQSLSGNRVSFAAVDERMTVDTTLASGAAVLLPRWEPIRALLAEAFGPSTIDPTSHVGAAASPAPVLPFASPSPLPFASPAPFASPQPDPSPLPRDPSGARPAPAEDGLVDPDYAPSVPAEPVRRS
jgi:LCP family protein required for cell wall assembly